MRKEYVGTHTVVWGHDNHSGFFVQVFDAHDDMLVWKDQSEITMGFSICDSLKRDGLIETLSQYSPDALEDFYAFEKEPLPNVLRGYIQDENGRHDGCQYLETYGDLLKFNDKIEKHFTLTDMFDCLVKKQ